MNDSLFAKRRENFQDRGETTAFALAAVAEALDTITELREQNIGGETVEQRLGEYKSWDPEIFKVDKDTEDGFRKRLEQRGEPVVLLSEEVGRLVIGRGEPAYYVVADPFDGSWLFKRGIPDFWYSSLSFFDPEFKPVCCAVGDAVARKIAFADSSGAYLADLEPFRQHGLPERALRIAEKVKKKRGFSARTLNMRRFDEEVNHVKRLYNSAWSDNWGFVPMTDREMEHIAAQLRQLLDPDLCIFIEKNGEPVGFALILPDLNRPLLKAYPHPDTPEWWTMLKLVWHWKVRRSVYTARAYAGGLIEPHRGVGADAVMAIEVAQALLRKGYRYCEISWILENNLMMRRMAEAYGGKIYRTYRVYEKAL